MKVGKLMAEFGFKRVGEFLRKEKRALRLEPNTLQNKSDGVYAFAVNREVVYIGETGTGLRTTIKQYERGDAHMKTRANVHDRIVQAVRHSKTKVEMYFLEEDRINDLPQKINGIKIKLDRKTFERVMIFYADTVRNKTKGSYDSKRWNRS